ncbi:MAG: cbb3-type cytochrome c oxidase subunit 3 [Rhodospirillaceae bacterium]|nr:cbb3-type cytochrome c oxidase subunit 3 [Rhodospirillaceae bacterium]
MTHEIVLDVALNSGLIYFVGLFAVVLAYVLWPANRKTFERAARLPLDHDEG